MRKSGRGGHRDNHDSGAEGIMIVGGGEIKVNDSGSNYSQGRDRFIHPKRGSEFFHNMDHKRSEGAIFETPRDHRQNDISNKKIQNSLFNIAGILKLSKKEHGGG